MRELGRKKKIKYLKEAPPIDSSAPLCNSEASTEAVSRREVSSFVSDFFSEPENKEPPKLPTQAPVKAQVLEAPRAVKKARVPNCKVSKKPESILGIADFALPGDEEFDFTPENKPLPKGHKSFDNRSMFENEYKHYGKALALAKKIGLEDTKRAFGKAEHCSLTLFIILYSNVVENNYNVSTDEEIIEAIILNLNSSFYELVNYKITEIAKNGECCSILAKSFYEEHDRVQRNSISSLTRTLLYYYFKNHDHINDSFFDSFIPLEVGELL